jgi:RNA-splicing ligase RtcB
LHNEAKVFAKALEASCEDKIRQYLNHPAFAGTKVRIMPDVHIGKGAIIGYGKGNPEWNYSAPHGAGQKIARGQARTGLSLDEYRKEMRGIWSSTVCKDTLEESPMAYKRAKDILDYIGDTVEIEHRLKPLYNFKAVD